MLDALSEESIGCIDITICNNTFTGHPAKFSQVIRILRALQFRCFFNFRIYFTMLKKISDCRWQMLAVQMTGGRVKRCHPYSFKKLPDTSKFIFYIHRVTFVANVCSFYYESKALAANFNLHNNSSPLQYFVAAKRSSWLVTRRVAVNCWPKRSWSFGSYVQQRRAADHAR